MPLGLGVTLEFVGPLAGVGIALIAPWGGHGIDGVGMLLALAAGGCWAVYIVLGGRVAQVLPGNTAVAARPLPAAVGGE